MNARTTLVLQTMLFSATALAQSGDAVLPWYRRSLVGMEVGPTGAQLGADPKDTGYARLFSGRDIVAKQIEAHSDYVVVWAKDSEYAYYDSKVAPKCPGLGARDPLREAVEAAKPHGLPVIAYCVVQGNGYPLRDHPEFKMVGADGQPIDRICLNSGYMEHAKAVAAEMLEYGIDGFHIDMLDQGFGPPYGCWCASCEKRYKAEYDSPMPRGVTWDAAWDRMMAFRYDTSARFERELLEFIRSRAPKVSVDFNYHGYPPFSWEVGQRPVQHAHVGDFVTCESGVWGFSPLGAGLTAEFVRATGPDQPYQVVMQRGVRMYHDQTTRPLNDLRWEMFALLAHGAQVTIVDKTPFDGSLDPVAYARMGEVFEEVQAKRAHFGQAPVYEVGVYYSSRSRDWYGRETPAKYEQSFFGAHKALAYEHIPMGVLLDENVTIEALGVFPVVVLPDAAIVSEEEAALFRAYVEGGGNLVVTGITGLYDRMGARMKSGALADLIGAEPADLLTDSDNFFRLGPSDAQFETFRQDIPEDWPVLAYGPAVVYRATDAEPVGELLRPVRTLRQQQGLEGTGFPSSAGDVVGPAILVRRLGKGTVVTLAVSPGAAVASEYRMPEARKLLRNVVRFLNPEPEVRIEAPLNVEVAVTDDTAARIVRVHLVGYLTPPTTTAPNRPYVVPDLIEDAPLYDARIFLKRKIAGATACNPETSVTAAEHRIDARIHDIHEVIAVSY